MGRGRLKPLATEIGQLLLVSGYGRGHPSNRGTAAQSLTPMVIIRLTAAASKPKNPAGAQSYEHFQVRAIPRYVLGIRKENYPDLEEGGSGTWDPVTSLCHSVACGTTVQPFSECSRLPSGQDL